MKKKIIQFDISELIQNCRNAKQLQKKFVILFCSLQARLLGLILELSLTLLSLAFKK